MKDDKKTVLLLLCKGVEIYEAAAFYDVLGWAGQDGSFPIKVITVGTEREVVGAFGLRLTPDVVLSDVMAETFDALAVPGGFEDYGYYEEAYSEPVATLIRRFFDLGKPIASICVGALPLAYSGILKGQKATTYHLMDGQRRKELASFGAQVIDAARVCSAGIMTSTSPATAIDTAFWLLNALTDEENTQHIRRLMGFE